MLSTHRLSAGSRRFRQQQGFTLVELMIAITLSLLLLAALTQAFVYNSRDRNEMENVSRQIESGRYAVRVMSDSIQHAGFMGEFYINAAMATATPLTLPGAKPDPCSTALDVLRKDFPIHIQGYDDTAAGLGCLTDVKANTDVVVVRHTSTCLLGDADCNNLAGAPYFQASLCDSGFELGSPEATKHFRLDTDQTNLNRTQRDCATPNSARRYLVHIYFVANNDQAGDGIPTLKRAALGAGGFDIQSIANGVENLQIEYGLDTSNDGYPDAYTANPDSFNACAGPSAACSANNWWNVMTAKLYVLARSPSTSSGYSDAKQYRLGLKADGSVHAVGPFNDAYKRHVYQTVLTLVNPSSRRR